jgi:adenylosuccinate synthase
VIGIFKAYCTRVGSGPFPTELTDGTGDHIRKAGNEFGSTTGRPRRCGWLDLPALRYAVMINGVSELAMMKADVLSDMDRVRVCTHYRVNGELTDRLPYDVQGAEPVYADCDGWGALGSDIPDALERYIRRIEEAVQVPVRIVSTGPRSPADHRTAERRGRPLDSDAARAQGPGRPRDATPAHRPG